ncbi:MAG: tRNA (guanosine(37)-N1)-methyltransferase TrmD [Candidatus Omnitrophica bacterium]|nr:tRNA (guanosine(37)-N1)-methyltransferase TrmD [Candidatus Omnitrophota bacterium]
MRIDILTLFPGMFENVLGESMLKRAQGKGLAEIKVHDLRDWTSDSHRSADDKPFGGGAGMVMKLEPIWRALEELKVLRSPLTAKRSTKRAVKVVLLTPQGKKLDQRSVKKLAKEKHLILICGHYEGVDERIRELADEEISIGDYILTCGELPAMVLVDSVVRLIPGVLGDDESVKFESFESGMLEYPQYTRPAEFKGRRVPQVLTSGDHKKIEEWRMAEALKRTRERRPDLLKRKGR